MAQQGIKLGHHIPLQPSGILTKEAAHVDQLITEVTDTELLSNNMNRDDGFSF
jgi:hypothetical protein